MKDAGEIFTIVVTLAVTVLGIVAKAKEGKAKKLVKEAVDEQEPVREGPLRPAGKPLSASKSSATFEEGQRVFEDPGVEIGLDAENPERKKLDIDKKNLIIYSELLKPKFDD